MFNKGIVEIISNLFVIKLINYSMTKAQVKLIDFYKMYTIKCNMPT